MSNTVRFHRVLRAAPEKVYRAFLDPDAMVKWLPPNGFIGKVHTMDARVGGTYKMSFTNFTTGRSHAFGGEYLELVPHERIRYSDRFDDPNLPGEMQTTILARYVALLRGINVGGNNLIGMPALKACFEAQGFGQVATYIQSGNVLFTTGGLGQLGLTRRIEAALSQAFAYRSRVVVRSREQMKAIVAGAPKGFGDRPTAYRYDVIFLKEPLSAEEAMASVSANPGWTACWRARACCTSRG